MKPEVRTLASFLRVVKGESSKLLKGSRDKFWQARYYDFNTFTTGKFVEKVQYIHRNPVTRGLVARPEDYRWSSFNHYATGQSQTSQIDSQWAKTFRVPRETPLTQTPVLVTGRNSFPILIMEFASAFDVPSVFVDHLRRGF